MKAVGIPSRLAKGKGKTSISLRWETTFITVDHVWNEVYVDDRWVMIDATWMSGNKYKGGEFISGNVQPVYFDMDLMTLSDGHKIMKHDLFTRH